MKILLIGNGELSSREKELIYHLKRELGFKLAAVDGGLGQVEKLQLAADYHLGDFDSSQVNVDSIELNDQSLTDLEKSLIYLGGLGFKEFHLFAFHGKRFDHAINNLEITFRMSKTKSIFFYTEDFKVYVARDNFYLLCEKNKVVSVFSFSSCTFKSSKGLKYPLDNLTFSCGLSSQGISNLTTSNAIEIEFAQGEALIFIEH